MSFSDFFESGILYAISDMEGDLPENIIEIKNKIEKIEQSRYISEMKSAILNFSEEECNFINNKFLDKLYECFKCVPPWEQAIKKGYLDVFSYIEKHIGKIEITEELIILAASYNQLEFLQKYNCIGKNPRIDSNIVNIALSSGFEDICIGMKNFIINIGKFSFHGYFKHINILKFLISANVLDWKSFYYYALGMCEKNNETYLDFFNQEYYKNSSLRETVDFDTIVYTYISPRIEKEIIMLIENGLITEESQLMYRFFVISDKNSKVSIDFFSYILRRFPRYPSHTEINERYNKILQYLAMTSNIECFRYVLREYNLNLNDNNFIFTLEEVPFFLENLEESEYPKQYGDHFFSSYYFSFSEREKIFTNLIEKSHFRYSIFKVKNEKLFSIAFEKYKNLIPQSKMEKIIKNSSFSPDVKESYLLKITA